MLIFQIIKKALVLTKAAEGSFYAEEKKAMDKNLLSIRAFYERHLGEKCVMTIFQEGNGKERRWRFSPQYPGEKFLRQEEWSLERHISTISVTEKLGGFLLKLAHRLRCRYVLEIGSAFGVSSTYLLRGLLLNKEGGHLHTIEKMDSRAPYICEMLSPFPSDRWSLFNGDALEILAQGLYLPAKGYDLIFVDAFHQKKFNLDLFEVLLRISRPGCVMIFDDISWSAPMAETWSEIKKNRRVIFSQEFHKRFGMAVIS